MVSGVWKSGPNRCLNKMVTVFPQFRRGGAINIFFRGKAYYKRSHPCAWQCHRAPPGSQDTEFPGVVVYPVGFNFNADNRDHWKTIQCNVNLCVPPPRSSPSPPPGATPPFLPRSTHLPQGAPPLPSTTRHSRGKPGEAHLSRVSSSTFAQRFARRPDQSYRGVTLHSHLVPFGPKCAFDVGEPHSLGTGHSLGICHRGSGQRVIPRGCYSPLFYSIYHSHLSPHLFLGIHVSFSHRTHKSKNPSHWRSEEVSSIVVWAQF